MTSQNTAQINHLFKTTVYIENGSQNNDFRYVASIIEIYTRYQINRWKGVPG